MMLLHTKSSGKFSHYHSCLQSISPWCSRAWMLRQTHPSSETLWAMSTTFGSPTLSGLLVIGVCTCKASAPTTIVKDRTTAWTDEQREVSCHSTCLYTSFTRKARWWKSKPIYLAKKSFHDTSERNTDKYRGRYSANGRNTLMDAVYLPQLSWEPVLPSTTPASQNHLTKRHKNIVI